MLFKSIEALRQLLLDSGTDGNLQGVYVSDTAFSHGIAFPAGVDQVAIQFTLLGSLLSSDNMESDQFCLSVAENGCYIECYRGGEIFPLLDGKSQHQMTSSGP